MDEQKLRYVQRPECIFLISQISKLLQNLNGFIIFVKLVKLIKGINLDELK